jgi:hypothetical protein
MPVDLFCPRCGEPLKAVSRRDDYFCRACHGALVVIDATFALWQAQIQQGEALVTLETLRQPPCQSEADQGMW